MPPLRGRDHMQSQYPTQESSIPTWADMTQMEPQYYGSTSQQPRNDVTGIVEEFFGGAIFSTDASLIPPNQESQFVFQTPSPPNETRTENEKNQYGRGLRQHRVPNPWSPSGGRQRPPRRRRQA